MSHLICALQGFTEALRMLSAMHRSNPTNSKMCFRTFSTVPLNSPMLLRVSAALLLTMVTMATNKHQNSVAETCRQASSDLCYNELSIIDRLLFTSVQGKEERADIVWISKVKTGAIWSMRCVQYARCHVLHITLHRSSSPDRWLMFLTVLFSRSVRRNTLLLSWQALGHVIAMHRLVLTWILI